MKKIVLPHNGFVFVGDGRKALFLRNDGDEMFPNLRTETVMKDDNPPTREQGSDRPGKGFGVDGRRSAMEETDWHDLEEQRFAHDIAHALEILVRDSDVPALVVAAPPRTLAELRHAYHVEVKNRIIAEIDKDFTNQPIHAIERHLTG